MLRVIWSWLWRGPEPAYIPGWNAVRAEHAAEATARMLLGHAGKAMPSPTAAQRARRRA